MNLQTRTVVAKRPARRRGGDSASWSLKLYIFLYLLAMAAIVFGIANYRIGLNRKINDLQRAANRAQREIYELDRDIQALKLARERLSGWEHIRTQIAAQKLPFREAEPLQVRRFTVRRRTDISGRVVAGGERVPAPGTPQLSLVRP